MRRQLALFTAVRTAFNTAYRMAYPFLSTFARGVGVPPETLALALTARSVLGALGPFLAAIADRVGRRAGMRFGLVLFVVGLALVSLWPTFPALFLALTLVTLGKYVFDPSMQAYLGDRVRYERRGTAIAVTEVGWSLAFLLGMPLVGWVMGRWGWRAPFPLLAAVGVLALLALQRTVPPDPPVTAAPPSVLHNLRAVLTHPAACFGLLVGLTASAANEAVNLVFGLWLEDAFGLKLLALGGAAAVIGLSELGGEALVGGFTDRMGKRRAIALGLLTNSLAALALPLLGRTSNGALLGLFLFYITFEFTLVSSIPLMTEVLPQARATVMAANVAALSLGRALGAGIAPPLYAFGILGSVLGAVALNLIALTALTRVAVQQP